MIRGGQVFCEQDCREKFDHFFMACRNHCYMLGAFRPLPYSGRPAPESFSGAMRPDSQGQLR
jgi:hypothetical protein